MERVTPWSAAPSETREPERCQATILTPSLRCVREAGHDRHHEFWLRAAPAEPSRRMVVEPPQYPPPSIAGGAANIDISETREPERDAIPFMEPVTLAGHLRDYADAALESDDAPPGSAAAPPGHQIVSDGWLERVSGLLDAAADAIDRSRPAAPAVPEREPDDDAEIMDRIDDWHAGRAGQDLTLPQHLGWTDEQFARYVDTGRTPEREPTREQNPWTAPKKWLGGIAIQLERMANEEGESPTRYDLQTWANQARFLAKRMPSAVASPAEPDARERREALKWALENLGPWRYESAWPQPAKCRWCRASLPEDANDRDPDLHGEGCRWAQFARVAAALAAREETPHG